MLTIIILILFIVNNFVKSIKVKVNIQKSGGWPRKLNLADFGQSFFPPKFLPLRCMNYYPSFDLDTFFTDYYIGLKINSKNQ